MKMITVQVSTMALFQLLDGKFSICAVEAIKEWLDENALDFVPMVGDIYVMFSEVEEGEEEDDAIVTRLPNGKVLTLNY